MYVDLVGSRSWVSPFQFEVSACNGNDTKGEFCVAPSPVLTSGSACRFICRSAPVDPFVDPPMDSAEDPPVDHVDLSEDPFAGLDLSVVCMYCGCLYPVIVTGLICFISTSVLSD